MIATLPKVNKIEVGDCVSIMKQWPDKSFDLCLTDFPFGIGTDYGCFIDTQEASKRLIDLAMPEILRVSKRAMITCGVQNIGLYPQPDWVISWCFPRSNHRMSWGDSSWQPILCYGVPPGPMDSDVLYEMGPRKKESLLHPCPKSLFMWKRILRLGAYRGSFILDPLMGSGTTAIAALQSGCTFSGIELNPDYAREAEERIAKEGLL